MNDKLTIRPFDEGRDLPRYVEVVNQAWAGTTEFVPKSLPETEMEWQSPAFDHRGWFAADWDGVTIGFVHAEIDPKRIENKGWLEGPHVLPEYRRRHIGAALLTAALRNFEERGIPTVKGAIQSGSPAAQQFLEHAGFRMVRVFSQMRRNLDVLPADVGENRAIEIRELSLGEESLALRNRVLNEAFKENYGFRPWSLDESQFWLPNLAKLEITFCQFAACVKNEPVGILTISVDARENRELGRQQGWLGVLGVLKPYRSQGIGRALLLTGMTRLKEMGMVEAVLGVDDANPVQALRLYSYLGFRVTLQWLTYEKELDAERTEPEN